MAACIFDVFVSDLKAMGRLLIAAFLMLVAGDNGIAGDQGPASAPPSQLQTNPSNEPSQSLMLACSGLLTINAPGYDTIKSGKSAVSDVRVVLYSNSANVFSSLFDVALPVTGLEGDDLLFETRWENDGIKYRIFGAIDVNGRGAVFNEIFVLNEVVKTSLWYLHCKEGAVPPPVDLTPQRPRCVGQLCLSIPAQISMNLNDWRFEFSAPSPYDDLRPSHGGWSLQFSLPQPTRRSQSVYFASATASPLLIRGWYVKVGGRASPLPPGMDCRMYFSGSRSADLSGQYQLWRSTKPLIPGANGLGDFVQVVGLEPEFWSTVTGEPGNWSNFLTGEQGDTSAAATAAFQQALANPQSIGIICGAYVRGDPYAGDSLPDPYAGDRILQFTMDSFAVCDPFAPSAKQQNEACAPPSAQQR